MKILVLSSYARMCKPTDHLRISDVNNTSTLFCYNLRKELAALGIHTDTIRAGPSRSSDRRHYQDFWGQSYTQVLNSLLAGQENLANENYDFAICCDQRSLFAREPLFAEILRDRTRGAIAVVSDNCNHVGEEDLLFYSVPDSLETSPAANAQRDKISKCKYTGWAADPKLCYPEQAAHPTTVRILLDHSYYGTSAIKLHSAIDLSIAIIQETCRMIKSNQHRVVNGKEVSFLARRFISGGVETLDINNPWFDVYNRQGLSYPEACREYRQADVFVVTHKESMGLSVLEAAMSGALILVPNHFIKKSLISDLNHIAFDANTAADECDPSAIINIPWKEVMRSLDPEKSRRLAMKYTWQKTVGRMLKHLETATLAR